MKVISETRIKNMKVKNRDIEDRKDEIDSSDYPFEDFIKFTSNNMLETIKDFNNYVSSHNQDNMTKKRINEYLKEIDGYIQSIRSKLRK